MRWTGHVTYTVKERNSYKILTGNPEETTEFEDLAVHRNVILKYASYRNRMERLRLDSSG
jgi:hypothetical protein